MPLLSRKSKSAIKKLINGVIEKYLKKAELSPGNDSGNPFITALFKDFDPLLHNIHGAKTSLGGEMEKIAEIIAKDAWGEQNVRRKFNVKVRLPQRVFREIDTIINNLSNAKSLSNYVSEKERILRTCNEATADVYEEHTYEFDMELHDVEKDSWYYLEMKGPDPNTTEVPGAKKRLLTEMAWAYFDRKYHDVDALFAIYYNNQFPKPYKNPKVLYYFDPAGGLTVHDGFWNFIGKSDTTYTELLKIFSDYGKTNKKRIWDGFYRLLRKPNQR